jgi:hypothetical protein
MPATVTNRSRTLVTLRLNSGDAVHLAPQETTHAIPDFELRENSHLAKLVDRRLVEVTEAAADEAPLKSAKRSKADKR